VKLFAQHGWGKGDKIDLGLEAGHINGVILGPHDEDPDNLVAFVNRITELPGDPDIMVDPQTYVSLLPNANEGKLPLYPYYHSNLSPRNFSARNVQRFVREALDFQRGLQVSSVISPTIIQESFTDRTSQIALSLAQESIEYWDGITDDDRPLLVAFVFAENCLSSHNEVAEFLDTISLYEVSGFYLVIDRNDAVYSQDFQPDRLCEFLRMIFSLRRGHFEVVCGYCDFLGILYAAVGANAGATGWSQKLRRFNRRRFLPPSGGRQPRDRYSSLPLVNSVFMTELDACQEAGRLRAVKSNTPYDRVFDGRSMPSGVSWPAESATLHHWATLAGAFQNVAGGTIRDRLQILSQMVTQGQALYTDLAGRGITFEVPNGPTHLQSWADALEAFRRDVRI